MICLVHTHWNARPGLSFLATPPGRKLAGRLAVTSYQKLAQLPSPLPRALYLLGDLDVLQEDRPLVEDVYARLVDEVGAEFIFNDPAASLGRYDLLRKLSAEGINDFTIHRLDQGERPTRFPAFIRHERDHAGSRTKLIAHAAELDAQLDELRQTPKGLWDLVATEFLDTVDAKGVYRKYGAFCLGGEIIPRHLLHGCAWMLKEPEITTSEAVAEERAFQEENPHREILERVFSLAGIRYGRVDYAVKDGRPQIWEINTNPVIMRPVHFQKGPRLDNQLRFADRIVAALAQLDPQGGLPFPFMVEALARQQRFALGRLWHRFLPAGG